MATTIGTIQLLATIDTSQYKKGAKEIEYANKGIENSASTTEKKSNSAFTGIAKVGLAAVAAAAVAVGVAITKNMGRAVDRIDTLIAFPRVLQALGATSEEATGATDKLSDSLQGLPTSLQDGAKAVQQLVTTGLGVDDATDAFLAFNNAMLASSVDAGTASATFTQLQQALSRGRIDAQEWNSIAANMPTALQALQTETGLTREGLRELYRENPQQLIDDLVKLNKEGGGGLASLDEQARTATGGINTAFSNMNNAITRGIESIVRSLGDGDLEAGQRKISDGIAALGSAFETALNKVGPFINFIIRNRNVFIPLAIAISTVIGVVTTLFVIIKTITTAWAILNAVMLANPIGLVVLTVVGLVAALTWLWNNVDGFRNFWISAWDMITGAISGAFNWVKNNWPLLLGILGGPIGLAAAAIIKNFDNIKSAVGRVYDWIKGTFSTIGEIGSSIVKGAVNSVLGFAERTINGFIRMINGALGAINKIPGVNIGAIGELSIPMLAKGGIVSTPTLAMIGEGNESEAVIPLSKLDNMINGEGGKREYNIGTINIASEVDGERWLRKLTGNQEITSAGLVPTQSYMG